MLYSLPGHSNPSPIWTWDTTKRALGSGYRSGDACATWGGSSGDAIVSGFRLSLQQAADAKREAVGFTDSIFAGDIGKFPDNNVAESLDRIPGVTILRDINGAGVTVAIRGLGTSFTRVCSTIRRSWSARPAVPVP